MLIAVLIAGLFGAFIGSFLNVCVHRLPRNESVVTPPSRCYACGTQLAWYDNLPVVGWLLLRGRCRWCGTPFSVRYLLAELAVGGLTGLTVWWQLAHPGPWDAAYPLAGPALAIAAALALVWMLYVSSLIDLDHQIIPDELTKSFQLAAPFLALLTGSAFLIEDSDHLIGRLTGLAAGGDTIRLPPEAAEIALPTLAGARLLQIDVFGVLTMTPERLLGFMAVVVAAVVALLLLSLPLAKVIYSRFTCDEPWSTADHRGFRTGVLWFVGCTVVQMAVLAVLLVFRPFAHWALAAVLLAQAILGSLAGWCSLYLVGFLGTVAFRKNAMGFGDVKYLAPIGAFLGPVGVVYGFFAASIIGTLVGVPQLLLKSTTRVPFGPDLAAGSLLALGVGGWVHGKLFAGLW